MDIKLIPLEELLEDKAASEADIKICEWALLLDVTEYSGGSVQGRINGNQIFIDKIKAELGRRQKEELSSDDN